MNTKTLNRFSSIINLICVITFGLFFISDIIMADYTFFPSNTSIGASLTTLFSISALGLIVTISINTIINIVLTVQNRKNKKLFITYLFFAISELVLIIIDIYTLNDSMLLFDDLGLLDIYVEDRIFEMIPIVIATIMLVLQFVFIHKQDNDNVKNKKYLNKIFNIIIIIFLIITCITHIIFFIVYSKENSSINKYINNIKSQIKENCALKTDERYFAVCENDKWGYINDKGQNIIPCIYDYVSKFYYYDVSFNNQCLVSIAIKNNDYLLVFPNKNTINLGNNPLNQYEEIYNTPLERITNTFFVFNHEPTNVELYVIDVDRTDSKEYTYKNGNVAMKFEYYDEFEDSYTVTIQNGNNEMGTYKEESIPLIDSQIYVYSDGYIPFYNKLEGVQGWYELDGKKHSLNKNYRILDIKNNILVVRNLTKNEILFLDLSNNEIKLKSSEVMLCTNGYIIKSQNGKYIYLDNNLKPLTKEYEYIYSKEPLKNESIFSIGQVVDW